MRHWYVSDGNHSHYLVLAGEDHMSALRAVQGSWEPDEGKDIGHYTARPLPGLLELEDELVPCRW